VIALLAKSASVQYPEFGVRLVLDLVSIMILTHLLFLRRHGQRDFRDTFVIVNICVFAALSVIGTQKISAGVAFGLFAILSIISLRSEPYDNIELAYFFGALTLALVNGFQKSELGLVVLLDAIVLATVFMIDHNTLQTKTVRRRKVTLDTVETDVDKLRAMLSERMGVEVVSVAISDIDYVSGTTNLVVRHVADPKAPREPRPGDDD
jgi:uncharacterized protein DUF4956